MPEKVISDHGPQFNGQEFEQFSVQRKLKDSTFVPSPPPPTPVILKCMENHIKILKHAYRFRFWSPFSTDQLQDAKRTDQHIPAWAGFCSEGNWERELSEKDKPVNQEISAVINRDGTGSSSCKRLPLQLGQEE